MSEWHPIAAGIASDTPTSLTGALALSDESLTPKWRVFADDVDTDQASWSVSPGEWTVLGLRPADEEVVDLTHVRAMFRLTGPDASRLLSKICALDLGDDMFPNTSAARTLVAGVATELVKDDREGVPSYLILPSRSFGQYLHTVILDAGVEFGL